MYLFHLFTAQLISTSLSLVSATSNISNMYSHKFSEEYLGKVRTNLRAFHQNLDAGNFSTIGSLLAPDYYWNYEGNIILTRQGGQAALAFAVTSALNGLHAQDIYNIIDRDRGAVLFRISGRQSGPFAGLPLQEDGRYNVMSGETFTFNADAEARHVVTVTPLGIMKDQMRGAIEPPSVQNETLRYPLNKDDEYKELIRKNMASIHLDANAGNLDNIVRLTVDDVVVDENGIHSRGKEAFVKLVTAQNAGKDSFPDKLFHDFDILADGNFGAVNYLWQAPQAKKYNDVEVKDDAAVRMRSMLFFEFNDDGLIAKVTGVYDEGVVGATLTGTGGYLYP